MPTKKYISKIVKGNNDIYIKDKEARQNISSHAENTSNPHSVTKSQVGLSNVTNDAQVKRSEMGAASGVATLDSAGKVPTSQLPSYVDDVLEYNTKSAFPTTGEAGKIYVDKSANTTWRWSGTAYTQIKGDLAIGTTTGTAADGKVVNDHINNTSNPHSVTKAQVGLGSVVNTGDSATPVSGGTTKFTTGGAYTELNKKVDKVSGKGLSTNDYTTDEKNKLSGIASGAEVNQNAFSNVGVKVGDTTTTVAADTKTDTVTLIQGSNITLTADTTNDTITIAATDTKNTAGSTDSSSKLFLIGATEQSANPQTYSQDTAYVGTDGYLYSNSKKVLNVTGGVLESLNGITSTANSSTKVLPSASALSQSPIPKYLWHDLFALCRNCTPTYYTSTDNSTWTQATLDKGHFSLKDGFSKTVIPTTGVKGVRWLWSNSGLGYGCGTWLVINFTYSAKQATYTVLFESSSDGSTWTTRHSSSGSDCQRPIWHYVGELGKNSYFRLTITKDTSDTTKEVKVGAIKLLSYRWGDQGKGSEYEYPYDWDANGNIFSISAGNRDLGATNNYWKNLYVTNINGVAVGSSPKFTDTTYTFDGTYNASTNKAATVSTVNNAVSAVTKFSTAYIGAGASASAVAVAANLKSNLRRGAKTSVTASSNKLWVLVPSTYDDPTVLMGGIEVPMTAQSNTTVSGVTYKVWSSNNTYTGTFNVVLL